MASGTLNLCPDGESRSEWTISRVIGELKIHLYGFGVNQDFSVDSFY